LPRAVKARNASPQLKCVNQRMSDELFGDAKSKISFAFFVLGETFLAVAIVSLSIYALAFALQTIFRKNKRGEPRRSRVRFLISIFQKKTFPQIFPRERQTK